MNIEINAQPMEVWIILPTLAIVFDPGPNQLEIGFYFLKYSITIKTGKR
jgi:hypothetical protein